MKRLPALLAAVLLAACAYSCGSSDKHTNASATHVTTTSTNAAARIPPAPAETKADADRDNDIGSPGEDNRNLRVQELGQAANAADRRAITSLIKRYYAAALAENGARACSLLYSTLAEAITIDYSGEPGVSYMQGAKTCGAAMALYFKHFHPQLVAEVPKLEVTLIHLVEHHGLAQLRFGTLPERETSIQREGHTWKMTSLLDNQLR